MLPRHDATGPRPGKAVGEGAPSQKTCRSPPRPEPLVEGGFVPRALVVLAVSAALVLGLAAGAAPSPPKASPAFPVTATTGLGKVTIRQQPKRIVSLSPTATETLFAIGAGKQVVAVDDQSDYPKSAPKTALSGFTPNVEAIASYRPDLVVIAYDPKGLSDALGRLGITVLHQDGAKSFKGA